MKEKFRNFNFTPAKLELIERANKIIIELMAAGYTLTLRQLYYQLVARDIIANKQTEYKRLGDILNDARLAGLVDWNSIEDRTRNLESVGHWESPSSIVEAVASQYRIDKWAEQEHRIEVWVEKDALVGVIEKAGREMDVAWFSCRGYTSQSELYGAGKRLARYARGRQTPVVIHLGDHDPSGIDMTRDITDRLQMFAGRSIKVERIALNMDQIEEFNPPPNPAKTTDCRYAKYAEEHGDESWELDALTPQIIHGLIVDTISKYRDEDLWREAEEKETRERKQLGKISHYWDEVAQWVDDQPEVDEE